MGARSRTSARGDEAVGQLGRRVEHRGDPGQRDDLVVDDGADRLVVFMAIAGQSHGIPLQLRPQAMGRQSTVEQDYYGVVVSRS